MEFDPLFCKIVPFYNKFVFVSIVLAKLNIVVFSLAIFANIYIYIKKPCWRECDWNSFSLCNNFFSFLMLNYMVPYWIMPFPCPPIAFNDQHPLINSNSLSNPSCLKLLLSNVMFLFLYNDHHENWKCLLINNHDVICSISFYVSLCFIA
jgi:hypothetical protein